MKINFVREKGWKKVLLCMAGMYCCFFSAGAVQKYRIKSPDRQLMIEMSVGQKTLYEVSFHGTQIIAPSEISMTFDNGVIAGEEGAVVNVTRREVKGIIPLVYGKTKQLEEHYNEMTIDFEDGYSLVVRAYDEGVAYRFVSRFGGKVKVMKEQALFRFAGLPSVWFPAADSLMRSWERVYVPYEGIQDIGTEEFCITPALFSRSDKKWRIIVAESDLHDYPGLYLQPKKDEKETMEGRWAACPKNVTEPDNVYAYHRVIEREPYIAVTDGTREYPWRIVMVTDDDRTLLTNELIFKLAKPQAFQETDWITTGKSVWEWWHDAILEGVEETGRLDFEKYKVYVDYAAEQGLEFVTMDAGWTPDVARETCEYAKKQGVKVILWDYVNLAVMNLDRLTELKNLGAAGVKIDLIERDDQPVSNWIEALARECAERKLLLVLHGCPKPTGLQRTYPNIVNYEAVRGAECNKWDGGSNARYHLLFPFIRMLAGPLDYTPGSMRNQHANTFVPVPKGIPQSIGTRAHELAMYVVFDHPLAYLCDSPIEYRKYPDIGRFWSTIPTVWDQTIPLQAEVGEYVLMARNRHKEWFVGGMTNEKARTLEVDFSFLPEGDYRAEIYRDNHRTDTDATAYEYEEQVVNNRKRLSIRMAPEGGFVIRLTLVTE